MTFKYWESCAAREGAKTNAVPVSAEPVSVFAERGPADETLIDTEDTLHSALDAEDTVQNELSVSKDDMAMSDESDDRSPETEVEAETDIDGLPVTEATLYEATEPDIPDGVVPETEIVDLQEIRRDREDNARINREVDEFFEEEERMAAEQGIKKKSLARKIFVDGLLGIPLLIASYLVASAFLVFFALITAAFFVAGLAVLIGAVIVITNSFRIFSVNVPTALVCIGASIAAIGLGLILFILCLLTAKNVLPLIIRLPIAFEKKLRLFKDGEEA